MKPARSTLYLRAVQIANARPTLSANNLKTALGCSDAQAKSFMTVMQERGVVGRPIGPLGRSPCLHFKLPDGQTASTVINLHEPEKSTLATVDVPIAEVLDGEGQRQLQKIVDAITELEDQKDVLMDGLRACYDAASAAGISAPALRKTIKIRRKALVKEFQVTVNLIELYLHTLGDLIEDEPTGTAVVVH